MTRTTRLLIAALACTSVVSIVVGGYAYRTRQVAINGWNEAIRLQSERDAAIAGTGTDQAGLAIRLRDAEDFQKATVLRDAGSTEAAVRDYVYRKTSVGSPAPRKSPAAIYAALGEQGGEQLCGGMAAAHAWALDKIGIPARVVQLAGADFLSGKDQSQTHVTVEAQIDGKWRISDPTFNISVSCSTGAQNLSVPEAADCLKNGGKLIPVPGKTQIAGRSTSDYYAPYETFFASWDREAIGKAASLYD